MSVVKILVVRGGAIGDFILTLPVFAALRETFPETCLEFLGYAHVAALAQAGGLVDAVRSIEARAMAGFFAKSGPLDEGLRDFFASFAIIISYLYDPDGVFQANVARCSKAQFIAGPHRPDERAGIHATEVFLKPLERLAIFSPDATARLRIVPESRQDERAESQWLAVHPGSGSERKNWPEAKWAELVAELLLSDDTLNCLLIGGEAEGERISRLASSLPRERIEIAQNLPLVELARRMAGCALFAGHDSGISHLAAALELPMVVLWGESNEGIWRPKGPNVTVIKCGESLPSLPVNRVLETLRQIL